jgi:hypothetical protein
MPVCSDIGERRKGCASIADPSVVSTRLYARSARSQIGIMCAASGSFVSESDMLV